MNLRKIVYMKIIDFVPPKKLHKYDVGLKPNDFRKEICPLCNARLQYYVIATNIFMNFKKTPVSSLHCDLNIC